MLSSLGPSLAAQAGGAWSSVSFRPIPSLLQTMVPAGYTALQEERLAMVDLGTPKPETIKNGFHREPADTRTAAAEHPSVCLMLETDAMWRRSPCCLMAGFQEKRLMRKRRVKRKGSSSQLEICPKSHPSPWHCRYWCPSF